MKPTVGKGEQVGPGLVIPSLLEPSVATRPELESRSISGIIAGIETEARVGVKGNVAPCAVLRVPKLEPDVRILIGKAVRAETSATLR